MAPGSRQEPREQRPHRPHALGPRLFTRRGWWCADLRPWGGGRVTLRDPGAAGWPGAGERTRDEATARRWVLAYWELAEQAPTERVERGDLERTTRSYLAHLERQRRAPSTIAGARTALRHLQAYLGPDHPTAEVGPQVRALVGNLLDAGYAASTLRTYLTALGSFFEWAGVTPNPTHGIELPDGGDDAAVAWDDFALASVRQVAGPFGLERLAFDLAVCTGARQRELLALERGDFAPDGRTVWIQRQLTHDGGSTKLPKSGRSRIATVLPGLTLPDRPGRVLAGLPLHSSQRMLRALLKEAHAWEPGSLWHRCRHTYARLFLERGGRLVQLQKSLGHASLSTTERYYEHYSQERAADDAAARIWAGE